MTMPEKLSGRRRTDESAKRGLACSPQEPAYRLSDPEAGEPAAEHGRGARTF